MVSERRPGKGKKGEHMKYSNFRLSKKDEKKYVVIIGCGRLGASLAAEIYGQGNDVCIADRDRDAFRKLDSSYGGLTETGDAADLETLSRASAEKADCLILVTDNDNINIMISQMAESLFYTKKIVCRLYDPEKECIYRGTGIETICPAVLSAREIEKLLGKEKAMDTERSKDETQCIG